VQILGIPNLNLATKKSGRSPCVWIKSGFMLCNFFFNALVAQKIPCKRVKFMLIISTPNFSKSLHLLSEVSGDKVTKKTSKKSISICLIKFKS
jgi:hypothetical protein